MFDLGIQKYFMIALVLLLFASAGAATVYRSNYLEEQQKRTVVEASLKQTTEAFAEFSKSTKAALDAVTRAANTTRAIAEQGKTTRERILTTSNDQDGPVAPVLRDVILGVR